MLTDLKVTNFITPVTSSTSVFSVGNFEIPGVENLYWLAPEEYRGNKLESYGSTFVFNVQWVVMRGDTSGEPTIGPDIVLVGTNGLQIGTFLISLIIYTKYTLCCRLWRRHIQCTKNVI